LQRRLTQYDAGKSIHRNKFKPWVLVAYIPLPETHLAEELEDTQKAGHSARLRRGAYGRKMGKNPETSSRSASARLGLVPA
jgi:hypothetical protein